MSATLRSAARVGAGSQPVEPVRYLRAFWRRAYSENITGLAGMVAYNLLLALFPFALLVLFIFGLVIQSPEVEDAVLRDLQGLFPSAEQDTLQRILNRVGDSSTTIGVVAALGALWIGASFWGAMDTAFCRIYHVQCRGWLEQKRFALWMLAVVVLFLGASVVVPASETLLISQSGDLPFGLDEIQSLESLGLLAGAVVLIFVVSCVIYYFVPKGHMPWRGVWPGAAFLTVTSALANWLFPFYLVEVSNVDDLGGAIGFILVALIWFYLLSLAILAGAVINALRYELHDTGTLSEGWSAVRPDGGSG